MSHAFPSCEPGEAGISPESLVSASVIALLFPGL